MLLFSDNVTCIVKLYLRDSLCLFTTVSLISDILRLRLGRLRRLVLCQSLGETSTPEREARVTSRVPFIRLGMAFPVSGECVPCSCLSRSARTASSRTGSRLPAFAGSSLSVPTAQFWPRSGALPCR
jgi:hypothetical protein